MSETQYTAFLRAINVGGHRIIKMETLRTVLDATGYSDIATYIQSGNVIFRAKTEDAAGLERQIEAQIQKAFGFEVDTFVRRFDDLVTLAAYNPFSEHYPAEGAMMYVTFLREEPALEQQKILLALQNDNEAFHFRGRELFVLRRQRLGNEVFSNNLIEKIVQGPSTTRNVTTLHKIVKKYQ